VTLENLST